jgi:hypothetical protein
VCFADSPTPTLLSPSNPGDSSARDSIICGATGNHLVSLIHLRCPPLAAFSWPPINQPVAFDFPAGDPLESPSNNRIPAVDPAPHGHQKEFQ